MSIQIKVRTGISNVRDLRADLLTAAYEFADRGMGTTLILSECRLSLARVRDEERRFKLLLPEAATNISVRIQGKDGEILGDDEPLAVEAPRPFLPAAVAPPRAPGVGRRNVTSLLLLEWLAGGKPMTMKALGAAAGTSYPTTAAVIRDLAAQGVLTVERNRRVSLARFPVNLWRKWVVTGFAPRHAVRFVDISGQPRTPSNLIKRLMHLGRDDIAVSGIEGARIHFPDLDLSGALRPALVVHGNQKSDLEFVKKLDPALQRSEAPNEMADLVIHFLDRPQARFIESGELLIADPLECLADLYEMRLDQQADEMLRCLIERGTVGTGHQAIPPQGSTPLLR